MVPWRLKGNKSLVFTLVWKNERILELEECQQQFGHQISINWSDGGGGHTKTVQQQLRPKMVSIGKVAKEYCWDSQIERIKLRNDQ